AQIQHASDGVATGGLLYYTSSDGDVIALHLQDGTQAWRTAVSPTPIGMKTPTVADGLVAAVDIHRFLTPLDAKTGPIRRTSRPPADVPGTHVIVDGTVYEGAAADGTTGQLVALDATDGSERWRIDRPLSSPTTIGSTGYVVSQDGAFAAIDLTSGKILWEA